MKPSLTNTDDAWGVPAKAFHWVATVVILILLGHGWWMTHVIPPSPVRFANFSWHVALGYDFLALMVLRLLWRWSNRVPTLPGDTKRWERIAAHTGHFLLYVLTFAATLAGWAMAGTMRTPPTKDLFGIPFPLIYASQDQGMHGLLEDAHKILSYMLCIIIVVHIAGALRHHFIKRNSVLRRMLGPETKAA